jgi:hypothetical protein
MMTLRLGDQSCRRPLLTCGLRWPDEGYEAVLGLTPPQGYVDALGELIDPTRFDNGIVISSSEEVWDVGAGRVAQAWRFREWEFH